MQEFFYCCHQVLPDSSKMKFFILVVSFAVLSAAEELVETKKPVKRGILGTGYGGYASGYGYDHGLGYHYAPVVTKVSYGVTPYSSYYGGYGHGLGHSYYGYGLGHGYGHGLGYGYGHGLGYGYGHGLGSGYYYPYNYYGYGHGLGYYDDSWW